MLYPVENQLLSQLVQSTANPTKCVSHPVVPNSAIPWVAVPCSSVHGVFQARILEWFAISFSKGSCQARNRTWVSCTASRFFTKWATREALYGTQLKYCWSWTHPLVVLAHSFSHALILQPYGWQHDRLPCPSPPLGICSNSCPLSWWCHPICILCPPLLLLSSVFLSILIFSSELALFITWPKYRSFSISPSNEYPVLISFRMDWFELPAVQGTLESFPVPQFEGINSLALSFLYSPTLTSLHDYWKNHSFDYTDLCRQINVSVFLICCLCLSLLYFQGARVF